MHQFVATNEGNHFFEVSAMIIGILKEAAKNAVLNTFPALICFGTLVHPWQTFDTRGLGAFGTSGSCRVALLGLCAMSCPKDR